MSMETNTAPIAVPAVASSFDFLKNKNIIVFGSIGVCCLVSFYLYRKLRVIEQKMETIENTIYKKVELVEASINQQQHLITQKMQLFETMSAQQKIFINQKVDELASTVQAHIQFIKKQNRMNESVRNNNPKKEDIEEREEREKREDKIVVLEDDGDDLDKELANEYKELENNI